MEEVLDGVLPSNLFELYSQCTADDPKTKLQQLLQECEEKCNVDETIEWLNSSLGLYPCHVGRFWFSNTLQRTRWEQLQVIEPYYTDDLIESQLLPLIHKQAGTTGTKRVSLRVLDWLVTNFSKKNRIIYFFMVMKNYINVHILLSTSRNIHNSLECSIYTEEAKRSLLQILKD